MKIKQMSAATALLLVASATFAQETGVPAATEDQAPVVQTQRSRPLSGAEMQESPSDDEASLTGMLLPSFTVSEVVRAGGANKEYRSAISGTLAYDQASSNRSFSMKYAGGLLFDSVNDSQNQTFHNLVLSEHLAMRRCNLMLGDTVSYLPQAPLNTASGITGLGDYPLGSGTINPDLLPSQSILTFDAPRVNNASLAGVEYHTSPNTSVNTVISYGILRYLDNNELDNHQFVVTTGLDHEMQRTKIAIKYSYSRFVYDVIGGGVEVHATALMISRLIGRNFSAEVSGGPQLIQTHSLMGSSRVVGGGRARLTYEWKRYRADVFYLRGTNNGSGLLLGAQENTVQARVTRRFRLWTMEGNGAYGRAVGVSQTGRVINHSAGGQLSRDFGRSSGTYLSYAYQVQRAGTLCLGNTCAFDDSLHTVGFGFYWHPRGLRLSR